MGCGRPLEWPAAAPQGRTNAGRRLGASGAGAARADGGKEGRERESASDVEMQGALMTRDSSSEAELAQSSCAQ